MKDTKARLHLGLCAAVMVANTTLAGETVSLHIDFSKIKGTSSPHVFGATQPRYLSDAQWDVLKQQGFTFTRSQADLTRLVPAESPEAYLDNEAGCADPANWDWQNGIYGNDFAQQAIDRGMQVCLVIKNARWNRHPGAPDDEETPARNLTVWSDVLTKVIDHYEGGIDYIELYNADRRGDGVTPKEQCTLKVSKEVASFIVSLEPRSVAGLVIHP